jgi:hypothetical protein
VTRLLLNRTPGDGVVSFAMPGMEVDSAQGASAEGVVPITSAKEGKREAA